MVVAHARPQPVDVVLDIAAGTGLGAIPVARLVGRAGRVVGVDISHGMLNRARAAVGSEGLVNVKLVQADAEQLNYPAGSFDLVTCVSALPEPTEAPVYGVKVWRRPTGPERPRASWRCSPAASI